MKATYFFVFAIVVVASAVRAEARLGSVQTAEIEKAKRDRKWLASMGGSFAGGYIGGLSPDKLESLFAGTTVDTSSVKSKIDAIERLKGAIHNIGLREATVRNIKEMKRFGEQQRALRNELKTILENSLNVPEPVEEEDTKTKCEAELTQQARDHKLALDKEVEMTRKALSKLALAEKALVEQTASFENAFASAQQECAAQHETAKAQCAAQIDTALNAQAEEFNTAMKQVQKAAQTALMDQEKEFKKAFAQAQEEFAAQHNAAKVEFAAQQDLALNAQAEKFDAEMKAMQKELNVRMQEQLTRQAEEFEGFGLSLSGESALLEQKKEFCRNFQNDPDRLTRVCA